jgi:hypothetical protein
MSTIKERNGLPRSDFDLIFDVGGGVDPNVYRSKPHLASLRVNSFDMGSGREIP